MNEKRLLDLIAAIGVTDDNREIRKLSLEMLRSIVWFDTANFWLYPPLAQPQQVLVSLDSPAKSLKNYIDHYINLDEFHQTYNRNNLLIARSTDLLEYSRWTETSEYYNDFLKSSNAYFLLGFDIKDRQMAYGALCLHREKHNGNFSDKDINLLRLLYPHLANRFRWLYEKQTWQAKIEVNSETKRLTDTHDFLSVLTIRERDIAQQVLWGKSNIEIAKTLGLSVNTVKMHLQNIFNKLGISRRSQLFIFHHSGL